MRLGLGLGGLVGCAMGAVLVLPEAAWARAGLVDYATTDSLEAVLYGLAAVVLAPVLLVYSAVTTFLLRRRKHTVAAAIARAGETDPVWSASGLTATAKRMFEATQAAWVNADRKALRAVSSAGFSDALLARLDQTNPKAHKNILDNILIKTVTLLAVHDSKVDEEDHFYAHFTGTMIDYMVDRETGEVVRGNSKEAIEFKELWRFVRREAGWRVDYIDNDIPVDRALNTLT